MQFVLQTCEILHFVRGLYDKNSASWYCFTSDVMYKKYKRKVYTPLDLLARFCEVNVSKAKIWPHLFSKNLFSRPNLLLTRAIMAMLFFGCTYKAINSINLTMTPGWPRNKPDLTMKETTLYSATVTSGKHGSHKYPRSFARLQRTFANTTSGRQNYRYITSLPFFRNKPTTRKSQ